MNCDRPGCGNKAGVTLANGVSHCGSQECDRWAMEANKSRPLYQIAADIKRDWKKPYFGAVPYLEAMASLKGINDMYGADDARGIVLYFLANAQTWRGETARQIKAELKAMAEAR